MLLRFLLLLVVTASLAHAALRKGGGLGVGFREDLDALKSADAAPEKAWHPHGSSVCAGPAMDRQIVRDLFAHTAEAGRLLQHDAELMAQIRRTRERLAPDRIGKAG